MAIHAEQLSSNPPVGRVTIRITSRIDRWKTLLRDVEVRAGDVLVFVPKSRATWIGNSQVLQSHGSIVPAGKSAEVVSRPVGRALLKLPTSRPIL